MKGSFKGAISVVATAGKEHERGPKAPGIQPEHKDDGGSA